MMMMPAGDNSWLVYQSSVAVLPAETSEVSRRNGRRKENFAYSVALIRQRIFTCRKSLRYGTSGFTSRPTEGVLPIFIALKIRRPSLNPRPLGPVASTLTTTPPRWQTNGWVKDTGGINPGVAVEPSNNLFNILNKTKESRFSSTYKLSRLYLLKQ
jgi:hypothetical protein